jgi:glycosyltransferase involved in cell wall biosynthesis
LYQQPAPASALPYTDNRINFTPVNPAGGNKLWDKLGIFLMIPGWLKEMRRAMRAADAVHIRCPAGISLVALLAARLWAKDKPVWVKYAGNWQPNTSESVSSKFQRWYLSKIFHDGVVTVNGNWPDQPSHILAFNNPSYTNYEYDEARNSVQKKTLIEPINILFVGRIEDAKGADRVIRIAQRLNQIGVCFKLFCIGDSTDRRIFEEKVTKLNLEDCVKFTGWISNLELKTYYQKAHFILLPSSASEGWPKVLSEAMAFGVVPITSDISSIPQILKETQAGIVLPADDVVAFVHAIVQYTQNPRSWQNSSNNSLSACERFTYDHYLSAVKDLFNKTWKVDLDYE